MASQPVLSLTSRTDSGGQECPPDTGKNACATPELTRPHGHRDPSLSAYDAARAGETTDFARAIREPAEGTTLLDATGLERYLHEQIPLCRALGVAVLRADAGEVRLAAPIAPNVNHHQTVFGGSLSAVAILAAWGYVYAALERSGRPARLVIRRNAIDYLAPATTDVQAYCPAPPAERWAAFEQSLARRRRGRIELDAWVTAGEQYVARFRGEYVAFLEPR